MSAQAGATGSRANFGRIHLGLDQQHYLYLLEGSIICQRSPLPVKGAPVLEHCSESSGPCFSVFLLSLPQATIALPVVFLSVSVCGVPRPPAWRGTHDPWTRVSKFGFEWRGAWQAPNHSGALFVKTRPEQEPEWTGPEL